MKIPRDMIEDNLTWPGSFDFCQLHKASILLDDVGSNPSRVLVGSTEAQKSEKQKKKNWKRETKVITQ